MEAQAGDVADQSGWELIRPVFLATIMCELQYVHIHPHKQPKLAAIIQSRRLTLFGHIMRMDDTTTQMPRGSCWPPLRQTGEDN